MSDGVAEKSSCSIFSPSIFWQPPWYFRMSWQKMEGDKTVAIADIAGGNDWKK